MKGHDVSFLRKQESRFIPAKAGTQDTWAFPSFWTAAFAGMTHGVQPAMGEASCFIWLQCYDFGKYLPAGLLPEANGRPSLRRRPYPTRFLVASRQSLCNGLASSQSLCWGIASRRGFSTGSFPGRRSPGRLVLPARRLYFHLTIEKLFGGRRAEVEGPVCQVLASPLAVPLRLSLGGRGRLQAKPKPGEGASPPGTTSVPLHFWRDLFRRSGLEGPLVRPAACLPPGGRGVLDCCFRRNDIQGGRLVPQTSRLPFLPLPW
jgi:hypothetical protein